jgi:MFS family permease
MSPRWHLLSQSAMHAVNDALFSGVYPLLPLVAAELHLSYAQVGAIKTAYSGASAMFQLPAGLAAERYGEQALLALGTGWTGLGLAAVGLLGAGFVSMLALTRVAGLGGNPQHPIATAIISRVFEGPRRATAIGTLNFAGDLGKVAAPAVAGLAIAAYGWRGGFLALGAIGALFALLYGVLALTRAMAADYAAHNIRVNCVCPSATDTPMYWQAGSGGRRQEDVASSVQGLSTPETIAAAFLYLASDRSPRVTGQVLIVDGGFTTFRE